MPVGMAWRSYAWAVVSEGYTKSLSRVGSYVWGRSRWKATEGDQRLQGCCKDDLSPSPPTGLLFLLTPHLQPPVPYTE